MPLGLIIFLLFCLGAESFVFRTYAASPSDVLINEIAWMGTGASTADEWIELFNNTDQDIGLAGWTLEAKDGTPTIALADTIPAKSYYLLERTDDNTISDLPANKIYTGALENSGEHLVLKDNLNNTIDEIDNSSDWLSGNSTDKTSMERVDPQKEASSSDNWATNNQIVINGKDSNGGPIYGTPKQKNSAAYPQDTTPSINYIVINEFLPDPEGSDQEGEFVELFNNSDTTADLSSWKIKDKTASSFTIDPGTTMPAYSYLAFYTGSKFLLNNSGDTVFLIHNNETLEEVSYSGPVPKNQSYNRKEDDTWTWSTTLTPGQKNVISEDEKDDSSSYPRHIWISEFLPDPEGKDTEGEFIELYNPGPDEIDLENWQLDDEEDKGSRPYTFPEDSEIKAGEYLSLPYSETKITLNNSGDWVRLLWPSGQAIDEIEYGEAPKAESYNKMNGDWCWSLEPTPAEQNICSAQSPKEAQEYPRTVWINEFLPDPEGKDTEGELTVPQTSIYREYYSKYQSLRL